MKKIVILASGLALAACGGGGGGSHSGSSASIYIPPRTAITSAVANSNAQITNMRSEIVVASNSTVPVGVVTTTNNGVTYASYRLDDVKLFTADNKDTTGHSYVNLELNAETGEIDAVKMKVGGEDSGRVVRNTETTFAGPIFEYVSDDPENDEAMFRVVDNGLLTVTDLDTLATENSLSGGHWNHINEQMAFKTYGKDVGESGLQYADFGYFNPVYRSKNKNLTTDEQIIAARKDYDDPERLNRSAELDKYRDDATFGQELAKEDYQLFAGGYAISGTTMLDTLVPENNTTYRGTAIGRVYSSIRTTGDRAAYLGSWNIEKDLDTNDDDVMDAYSDAAGHDIAKAYITSHATLEIGANGEQTLSMPFNTQGDTADKFYDVTITKATPNAAPEFTFTGDDMGDSIYRRNTTEGELKKDFTPGYYGVNTPVEAAGTAYYRTKQTDADGSREWEFEAAYGMQKQ